MDSMFDSAQVDAVDDVIRQVLARPQTDPIWADYYVLNGDVFVGAVRDELLKLNRDPVHAL